MSDMSRAVVRARNALAPFGGDEITEAIILLDNWLYRQNDATKRQLVSYFGVDNLPVSARVSASGMGGGNREPVAEDAGVAGTPPIRAAGPKAGGE